MDVLENILSRLPVKSLLRFQCVSKNWYDLIWSPEFSKLHLSRCQESCDSIFTHFLFSTIKHETEDKNRLNYYGFDAVDVRAIIAGHDDHKPKIISLREPQDSRVVPAGSCNGLVCLRSKNWQRWALYNPTTQAYMRLPNIEKTGFEKAIIATGFGYDCIGEDYKCVIISDLDYEHHNMDGKNVMVYSCKNKKWKDFVDPCLSPLIMFQAINSGFVLSNNALHWLAHDHELVIACFDLHHERLSRIALPYVNGHSPRLCHTALIDLRGVLHLVMGMEEPKLNMFYVWKMNEYGRSDSWVKLRLLDVTLLQCPTTVLYTERGEVRMHFECQKDIFVYWQDFTTAGPPNYAVEAVSEVKRCCFGDILPKKLVGCISYLETLVNPCH